MQRERRGRDARNRVSRAWAISKSVLSCICLAGLAAGCALSDDPKLVMDGGSGGQNAGGAGGRDDTPDSFQPDAAPEADAPSIAYDADATIDARPDVGADTGPGPGDATSEDARTDADASILDAPPDVPREAAPDSPPDVPVEAEASIDAPPEVISDAGPDVVEACVVNACGGCTTLAGQPNMLCGACGHYSCSGTDSVVCNNDPGYVRVQSIASGAAHTCALMANGGVRCWGFNGSFQLGDADPAKHPTPPATDLVAGVQTLATGYYHTCALSGGVLRCWGYNEFGQLGDGTRVTTRTYAQSQVALISSVQAMGLGNVHSCVLVAGGGVRCWGANGEGQLGYTTTNSNPVATPPSNDELTGAQAVVASNHSCALTASGGVRCWGRNGNGQLGFAGPNLAGIPATDVLTGVMALAVGDSHTCALTTTGSVRCWGANASGQLGDGSGLDRSTPSVEVLTGVTSISAGLLHTCALLTTGAVRCWGDNQHGSVGDGNAAVSRLSPSTEVLTGVRAISAGGGHTCAIMTAGSVRCWGQNDSGELGDGTLIDRPTPIDIVGIDTVCP